MMQPPVTMENLAEVRLPTGQAGEGDPHCIAAGGTLVGWRLGLGTQFGGHKRRVADLLLERISRRTPATDGVSLTDPRRSAERPQYRSDWAESQPSRHIAAHGSF